MSVLLFLSAALAGPMTGDSVYAVYSGSIALPSVVVDDSNVEHPRLELDINTAAGRPMFSPVNRRWSLDIDGDGVTLEFFSAGYGGMMPSSLHNWIGVRDLDNAPGACPLNWTAYISDVTITNSASQYQSSWVTYGDDWIEFQADDKYFQVYPGETVRVEPTWGCRRDGLTAQVTSHHASSGQDTIQCTHCQLPTPGNASCVVARPVLCSAWDGAADARGISSPPWFAGHMALSPPVTGTSLSSAGDGDAVCQAAFGAHWAMADNAPFGSSVLRALGFSSQYVEAWVYDAGEQANCWN